MGGKTAKSFTFSPGSTINPRGSGVLTWLKIRNFKSISARRCEGKSFFRCWFSRSLARENSSAAARKTHMCRSLHSREVDPNVLAIYLIPRKRSNVHSNVSSADVANCWARRKWICTALNPLVLVLSQNSQPAGLKAAREAEKCFVLVRSKHLST